MIWNVLLCVLAAWGILCGAWAALGWLLPGSAGAILVIHCPGKDPSPVAARCRWLLELGLLRGKLIVTGDPIPMLPPFWRDIETCSLEELPARLEAERID